MNDVGKPSQLYTVNDPDWAPTLKKGSPTNISNPESIGNLLSILVLPIYYHIISMKKKVWSDMIQRRLKSRRIMLEEVAQEEVALGRHWYVCMYILHHKLVILVDSTVIVSWLELWTVCSDNPDWLAH